MRAGLAADWQPACRHDWVALLNAMAALSCFQSFLILLLPSILLATSDVLALLTTHSSHRSQMGILQVKRVEPKSNGRNFNNIVKAFTTRLVACNQAPMRKEEGSGS